MKRRAKERIRKKKIKKEEALRLQKSFIEKKEELENLARKEGIRFHGGKGEVESVMSIRKVGLKKGTYFGEKGMAEDKAKDRSTGKFEAIHSTPPGFLEEKAKEGRVTEENYSFPLRRNWDITPPKKLKTFVKNRVVEKKSWGIERRGDPLLYDIEKKAEKEGKKVGIGGTELEKGLSLSEELNLKMRLSDKQHSINYSRLILADKAYEKHKKTLEHEVRRQLMTKRKVSFSKLKKVATELGILAELQDEVIGAVLLDAKVIKKKIVK